MQRHPDGRLDLDPMSRLDAPQAPLRAGRRLAAAAAAGFVLATAAVDAAATDPREAALFAALDRFDAGHRAEGLEALYDVTARHEDFLAARLIESTLLRTQDVAASLAELAAPSAPDAVQEVRDEAHARLSYWFERPAAGLVPEVLIAAARDREKVLVADTRLSRLYLFVRVGGDWRRRGDWYASIGRGGPLKRAEGDRRTPLGVYFITMEVSGRYLPDLYGAGALGLNYPNGWDRRRRHTGYGIWIHGVPRNLRSRSPRWSKGCLTVSNHGVEILVRELAGESAPVIIGGRLRWLAPADHAALAADWLTRIGYWNGNDVGHRDLGVYGYPVGESDDARMVLAEFRSGREGGGRWWQYWREHGDGKWQIAHEGPAWFDKVHRQGLPPALPPRALRLFAP